MQKCTSCGVNVTGERHLCPLCGRKIGDSVEESYDIFPKIPMHISYNFIFKISTFAMILAIIVINIINYIFIPDLAIYVPLSLGAVCAWIIINVGFKKRKNIPKNIMYEAIISVILCIVWDKLTGWIGWSIDYVLPVTSAALVVFYFIMGITDKKRLTAYAVYLIISEIGIVATAILLFAEILDGISRYFGVISVGIGVTLLIAQLIFRGKNFLSELHRWIHM